MLRVAVVEDEIKVLDGVSALIEKLNPHFEVVGKAQSGLEGMEIVLSLMPDVVVTDIKMPEMSGLEMMAALREKGVRSKFIILSGHADFKYAKKAIKLGSADYLLKPLRVKDLKNALDSIEETLTKAETQSIPLLENYPLSRILLQVTTESEQSHSVFCDELYNRFSNIKHFSILMLRCDCVLEAEEKKHLLGTVENSAHGVNTLCCVEMESNYELLFFIAGRDQREIEERSYSIWKRNRGIADGQVVFCYGYFTDIGMFLETFRKLSETAQWGISFPPQTLLSAELIRDTTFSDMVYPLDIEQTIFKKISSGKLESIKDDLNRLAECLGKERYRHADIRKAMLSLYSAAMYAIRKVSYSVYVELSHMELDQFIRRINTIEAFINKLLDIINKFDSFNRNLYECKNPIICNALRIIEAEYNSDISLETIATRLNLTVEYLSILFKKETGVRFSAYITQLRVDRAKELMVKKNIKVYMVARMVGYNDSAYFCKVFKRVTGMSPKDYINSIV